MSHLRKRTLGAIMSLLFISLAMPGCLSLVIGREMMESTRGKPNIEQVDSAYDLSHTWQNVTEVDDYHESKTKIIPIDHTVQEVIVNFQTSIRNNVNNTVTEQIWDLAQQFGFTKQDLGQRYVEVELFPCEEVGGCDAIYYQFYEGSEQNRTTFPNADHPFIEGFEEGNWRLTVQGQGIDASAVPGVGWQDSWSLWVTVLRPCVEFPEDTKECTPTVDI